MAADRDSSFDRDVVAKLATLARLELSEAESDRFAAQLTDILKYVEQVQSVDTTGAETRSQPFPLTTAWRDDDPQASVPIEESLTNAPDADRRRGLFRVPKVIG